MISTVPGNLPDPGGLIVAGGKQAKGRTEGVGQQRRDRMLPGFETLDILAEILCRPHKQPYRAVRQLIYAACLQDLHSTEHDWMEGHRLPKSSRLCVPHAVVLCACGIPDGFPDRWHPGRGP